MDPADTKEVDPEEESCQLEKQPPLEAIDKLSSIPGPMRNFRLAAPPVLSPITEISLTLGEASLATPTSSKQKVSRIGEYRSKVLLWKGMMQ